VNGVATFFDVRSPSQGFAYAAPGLTTGPVRVICPRFSSPPGPTVVIGTASRPSVADVGPRSGPQGSNFSIVGTNFGPVGLCYASIGGNPIYFSVRSPSQGFAYVEPSLAVGTSGPVRVHCPSGTSDPGPVFTVTAPSPPPTVTAIDPSSGARGTAFSITGTGFVAGQCYASIADNPVYLAVSSPTTADAYVEPSLPADVSGPVRVHCPAGVSNAGPTFTVTG
jgi:hypothetical protein